MTRFGDDPLSFFAAVYDAEAPWDIGGPQPDMVRLLSDVPPEPPVLDVGCGSGDLAIYLAAQGWETVGIDFVPAAIAEARVRRAQQDPEVAARLDVRVADALQPTRLKQTFGAVVDSGFYHLFEPDVCEAYVTELARVLRPGGRLYLHAFASSFPVPNVPRAVSAVELHDRFSAQQGWEIVAMRTGEFLSRVAAPVPAILACVQRR